MGKIESYAIYPACDTYTNVCLELEINRYP